MLLPSETKLIENLAETLGWEEDPPVDVWVEENVWLTRRFADSEGFMNLGVTPYTREPMQAWSRPELRELTLCWAAQVAKSMTLTAILCYIVVNREGQVIFTQPTADACKYFVKQRWVPIGEASDAVRREGGFTRKQFNLQEQNFKKVAVSWVGSNTAAQGAMRSAPYLLLDEVDKMGESTAKEPGFFHLIMERVKAFPQHKIVKSSTPTLNNRGIWLEYLKGDQRRYYVPSPHAPDSALFVLDFENVRWDPSLRDEDRGWDIEGVRKGAYYLCPHTGKRITDEHKEWMLNRGEWRPENPEADKRHRSYQISSLYSPWLTFGDVAAKFLESKDQPSGLHNFYNSWLGVPYISAKSTTTSDDLNAVINASPAYRKGTVPKTALGDPVILIITADVQASGVYWMVTAWWADETCAVVDWGFVNGFAELALVAARTYKAPSGKDVELFAGMIDAGYMARTTGGVYAFCLEFPDFWFPCMGRHTFHGVTDPVQCKMIQHKDSELEITYYNDNILKEVLYVMKLSRRAGPPVWLPEDADPVLRRQLLDEKLEETVKDGETVRKWKSNGQNHLGDCLKEGYVFFFRTQMILG